MLLKGGEVMPLTAKQMIKLLKKNGYEEIRQIGSGAYHYRTSISK